MYNKKRKKKKMDRPTTQKKHSMENLGGKNKSTTEEREEA